MLQVGGSVFLKQLLRNSVGVAGNGWTQAAPHSLVAAATRAQHLVAAESGPVLAAVQQQQQASFGTMAAQSLRHSGGQAALQQQPHQHQWLHQRSSSLGPCIVHASHPWQQWQQQRGLLGVTKRKNYQDHNKKKPKKVKIKTPGIARRRIVVGEDGVMWRMQAGRRHKRYKKSRKQLLGLKGMVPLHSADTAKLRKLGFKRSWWYTLKA